MPFDGPQRAWTGFGPCSVPTLTRRPDRTAPLLECNCRVACEPRTAAQPSSPRPDLPSTHPLCSASRWASHVIGWQDVAVITGCMASPSRRHWPPPPPPVPPAHCTHAAAPTLLHRSPARSPAPASCPAAAPRRSGLPSCSRWPASVAPPACAASRARAWVPPLACRRCVPWPPPTALSPRR